MMRFAMLALCTMLVACGPGERGPAGPAGPQGPAGPGGNSATVIYCSDFMDLTGTGLGVTISHTAYVFADGSMMTTCEVEGGANMSSAFRMYRVRDQGGTSAACEVLFDVDGTSGGWWSVDMNAARTASTATYHDDASGHHGRSRAIACVRP